MSPGRDRERYSGTNFTIGNENDFHSISNFSETARVEQTFRNHGTLDKVICDKRFARSK